jgi:thiol:disulfide interchange protein DsbC
MLRNTAPAAAECDIAALKRNREFGQKYNITGTPTLIFADGKRAPGAISAKKSKKCWSPPGRLEFVPKI